MLNIDGAATSVVDGSTMKLQNATKVTAPKVIND